MNKKKKRSKNNFDLIEFKANRTPPFPLPSFLLIFYFYFLNALTILGSSSLLSLMLLQPFHSNIHIPSSYF